MRSALRAVGALWRREVVKFLRDRGRVVGALAQPLAVWLMLGLGFHASFRGPSTAGLAYFEYLYPGIIAMVLLFTAIFSTISIVEDRKTGFLQAAVVAPVPRTAIVLGTVLGGTTLAVGQAALFVALSPLVGLTPSAAGLMVLLLAAFPTALAFTSLGFIMAWRLETTRGFHAVMNLFLLPLWFVSGALFPAAGAPPALGLLMRLNPAFYGVEGIRAGLYIPGHAPGATVPPALALTVVWATAIVIVAAAALAARRPRI